MEIGLAFGVRAPDDFYVVRTSATHDVMVLVRYLHGRKRDVREERVRTHGNEWHELRLDVRRERAAAYLDGRLIIEEGGLVESAGGVALWARVNSAGCFSEARVEPLPAGSRPA